MLCSLPDIFSEFVNTGGMDFFPLLSRATVCKDVPDKCCPRKGHSFSKKMLQLHFYECSLKFSSVNNMLL